MRVLAFDTACLGCSAAVLRDGEIRARRATLMARGQAEALMPMIAAVLAEAETPAAALDLIAVTTGPGAFTGLRIGLAAARGLGLATGVPVLGVTSFAAVAAAVPAADRAGRTLIVALDSKRRELFLQAFGGDGAALAPGAQLAPAEFPRWVPPGPLVLAGDGAARLAQGLPGRDLRCIPGPGVPDPADIARLAWAAWRPGIVVPPPRPLYLRPPDTTAPRAAAGPTPPSRRAAS